MAQSIPAPAPGWRRIPPFERAAGLRASRIAPWLAFLAVVGLAFALNAWELSGNGTGNTYYAAAARSMAESWHNFFFAAFDPGGFISVDKPPVFLWSGALAVRVFGFSSWALLLPSAIAGAASVALVWLIVRRWFGTFGATIAALVLALTPISVAVDRLNLPEPFLILALIGAAGATLQSLESRRWWAWVALAGFCVGVAFNTKMLAGWIPGPAFALAVVAGNVVHRREGWASQLRGWSTRLALLAAVTVAVSASWMLVVDAWPASDRPYVGGSTDNSVANLAFDYNGLGRVDGDEAGRGGGAALPRNTAPPTTGGANQGGGRNGTAPGGNVRGGGFPGGGNGGAAPGGNATGAGGIIAGNPGPWRMLDAANGGQIAWFLPFAVLGSVLCFWRWRRDRVRLAATVLFLGWVLLFAGVFSFAQGIYHSYYTSALAPGIAALTGMTAVAGVDLVKQDRRWLAAIGALAGLTLAVQLTVSGRVPDFNGEYRPFAVAAVVAGAVLLAAGLARRRSLHPSIGMAAIVAGLALLPASWSFYEAANPSLNTTLPQAGPRQGAAGRSFGSEAFDGGTATLAAWLEANRDASTRWDLVVPSAQNASTLIADYDLSVMALGGFLGSDPTITADQFADLVEAGQVRYVLAGGGFGIPGRFGSGFGRARGGAALPSAGDGQAGAAAVQAAVEGACTLVTTAVPLQYSGQIYDCAGKAAALRTG